MSTVQTDSVEQIEQLVVRSQTFPRNSAVLQALALHAIRGPVSQAKPTTMIRTVPNFATPALPSRKLRSKQMGRNRQTFHPKFARPEETSTRLEALLAALFQLPSIPKRLATFSRSSGFVFFKKKVAFCFVFSSPQHPHKLPAAQSTLRQQSLPPLDANTRFCAPAKRVVDIAIRKTLLSRNESTQAACCSLHNPNKPLHIKDKTKKLRAQITVLR